MEPVDWKFTTTRPAPGALRRTVAALLCSGVLRPARTCNIHRLFSLSWGNAGSPRHDEQPESASGYHAHVQYAPGATSDVYVSLAHHPRWGRPTDESIIDTLQAGQDRHDTRARKVEWSADGHSAKRAVPLHLGIAVGRRSRGEPLRWWFSNSRDMSGWRTCAWTLLKGVRQRSMRNFGPMNPPLWPRGSAQASAPWLLWLPRQLSSSPRACGCRLAPRSKVQ